MVTADMVMPSAAIVLTRVAVGAGAIAALLVTMQTAVNLRRLPRPEVDGPEPVEETVSVIVPARDEADTIGATLTSVSAQRGLREFEVIVFDDASSDTTADIVEAVSEADPRVRLVRGGHDLPDGWLGKPWACMQAAQIARGSVLVFLDADVTLEPKAVAAVVRCLRANGLSMLAPYPRQEATTWLERLTQPLVTWSPFALLPLAWQQSSTRASLSAANGQLVVVDAAAYRAVGGHEAVRDRVIEDVALMATMRRNEMPAWTADGTHLATCRMYRGAHEVVDGYGKSLWSAFGSGIGSTVVATFLILAFVGPAAAAACSPDRTSRTIGTIGYAAGVASRVMVSRRTGERSSDAFTHPASIAAFVVLQVVSSIRHHRGTARWKGRDVVATAMPTRTAR